MRYTEEKCFISAYDTADGRLLWKFYTIARQGEPGGDTWGNLPDLFRAGGRPGLQTVTIGSNLTLESRKRSPGCAPAADQAGGLLYANSTVALNPDTGN
jgi:alcohol dehydrogenase (cytochrome c)